jgi:DNA-directed RNA polymerase specialized sigma24 family protein
MLEESDCCAYNHPVDEQFWQELGAWLLPRVRRLLYDSRVLSLRGQQEQNAEDVVQEALLRTFEYTERARCGEVPPVANYRALCYTIARNYLRDCIRREQNCLIVHFPSDECLDDALYSQFETPDPEETALNHLMAEAAISKAAQIVVTFPRKQKRALLIDLANGVHFAEMPSTLERSLLALGIQLSDYQCQRSDNPVERSRHASLLCQAYKRLRNSAQAL